MSRRSNAMRWLDGLDASSVDLLITDPPYESLEKHRAIGTTTRLKQSKTSSNLWFTIFPTLKTPRAFSGRVPSAKEEQPPVSVLRP